MVTRSIFIDIGHGFGDPGAIASDGTAEHELVYSLGSQLVGPLTKLGISLGMAKTQCSLEQRGMRSRGFNAFLSLHLNSSPNKGEGIQGTECYSLSNALHPTPTASSVAFATLLSSRVSAALGIRNRGPKVDNLAVLRGAQSVACPTACLLESYFLTDLDKPACTAMITTIVPVLAQAISDYFDGKTE